MNLGPPPLSPGVGSNFGARLGGIEIMAGVRIGMALRDLGRAFDDGVAPGFEDSELLERFAARRDGAAFEAIVIRHGPMVLATCRGILRDSHAAEDAFQATFLTLARKAGTLRAGAALAGWLHRVARRVALGAAAAIARRRRVEGRSPALDAAAAPADPDDPTPILHEEIDRLPERYRVAIVLCYLEGMTHEQAAGHLRCPVGTVGSRVVRARELIRSRLVRRGLTGAAAALAAGPDLARAATVPEGWGRSAVASALGGPSPAGVVALSRAILGGAQLGRCLLGATAGLAAATALMVGLAAGQGPVDPPSRPVPVPLPAPVAAAEVPLAVPADQVAIAGRVVDPAGRPVEGAAVRLEFTPAGDLEGPEPAAAATGPDGRFSLRVARAVLDAPDRGLAGRAPRVVASAPGFGPAWGSPGPRSTDLREVTLTLKADEPPIRGRVVDLEGRPIAGVTVRSDRAWEAPDGALDAWIEAARTRGRAVGDGLASIPLERSAVTGPDGRFRIGEVGRDRVVELAFSGPTISTATAFAITRAMPTFRTAAPEVMTYHGATFDHVAGPTRPVVGTVRDADTGATLAGVRIEGMVLVEGSLIAPPGVQATTDAQGRYRLVGLAVARRYRVMATPAPGQPYPNAGVEVEAPASSTDPAARDLALKRGILVRGRITDRATGRPVRAQVETFAFVDNPNVARFPGYRGGYPPFASTGPDGRFVVVALPGRGILAARTGSDRYLDGVGAEGIAGLVDQSFPTEPHYCVPSNAQALAEIHPDPDALELTRDLEVDPGRTLRGTVLDPEGRPIAGALAAGLVPVAFWGDRTLEGAEFEATGVDARRPRRIYFRHDGRKLAGSALLLGTEAGPLVVRLQPWGTLAGRLVDAEGRPRADLGLTNTRPLAFDPAQGFRPGPLAVDAAGRFRADGLVPGLKYRAEALKDGNRLVGPAFEDQVVGPGEVRNLGSIVIKQPGPD